MKRALVIAVFAACNGASGDTETPPPPPPVSSDAGVAIPAAVDAAVAPADAAPAPIEPIGMHLDEPPPPKRPIPAAGSAAPPKREVRYIDLTLRSTPSGARAAIDGKTIGETPTYWSGEADGKPHDFTFTYERTTGPRYQLAHYRFVPVTSGVVHAKLEPLPSAEPDQGSGSDATGSGSASARPAE